ncbi:MAG: amidohydrolase family protein [Thermoanaerobaculia bacterium]
MRPNALASRHAPPVRRVLVAALTLALAGLGSPGVSLPAAAETAEGGGGGPVVLKAARMLDVEAGRIVEDATVVIEGGRIAAVNPDEPAEGARVIDLGDRTLLPGLMDLHTHLSMELEPGFVYRAVTDTAADAALRAAANARKTLLAGFTTVRDVGSSGFVDVSLAEAVEEGRVPGPRVVPSGHALSITGGHCDVTGFAPGILEQGPAEGVVDGPWEGVEAVRYQIKHGARWIKICATAGVLSFEGPVGAQQLTAEEMRAIVEEAARHGAKVAAHAHGTEGIRAAVEAGVASIEHGSVLTDEVMELMKERGTYLVPTTYLADAIDLDVLPPPIRAKGEEVLPVAKESVRRAIAAGVPIAFGTDAAVYPHGHNARELATLVERGMTPLAALRSATVEAASLLGVEDRGVIEAGRLADLIAVPGDPLEDVAVTERVEFVMKGGEVFLAP